MVILGLDISTTTIGYAFTENKEILDMGFIDLKKYKTLKDKAFYALTQLGKNSYIDEINKINVEDNLSGFMGGRTSQQTIIKLAKFNAIFCYILEEEFDIDINSINPLTIRKQVFGKARVNGVKAKDYVKMKIEEMYDTDKWCIETSRGNWDKRNIDMYDALTCSLFE